MPLIARGNDDNDCRCASVARTLVPKGKGVKTDAENEPLTLPRKNCTRSASRTAARICSHPHRRARGEALAIGGTTPYMAKTSFLLKQYKIIVYKKVIVIESNNNKGWSPPTAVAPAEPEQQTQDQSGPRRTSTTMNLRRYSR